MAINLNDFDPNSAGIRDNNLFGLPSTQENADLILLPVPWEVTTSYGGGTAEGPEIIFDASLQVDLYDPDFPQVWQRGIFMLPPDQEWKATSHRLRQDAESIIDCITEGGDPEADPVLRHKRDAINQASQ